jgi:hypothetical protein
MMGVHQMIRFRTLGFAGFAALAWMAFTAPGTGIGASPPAAPPDGSYSYAVTRSGQKIGDSAVTVKRDVSRIALHEVETFVGLSGQHVVDESVDTSGLNPTSFSIAFPLTPQLNVTARLTFGGGGAHETVDGTSGSTDFRLEPGTSTVVVIDGATVTGFLLLPAQVKAQGMRSFTVIAPSASRSLAFHVDGSANPTRPADVPAADASLSITGTPNFVEWYDPQTMLVDELDVPAQQVTITRAHGTH